MNISKYMSEELIDLNFSIEFDPMPEECNPDKWLQRNKESILKKLIQILIRSDKTVNNSKLLTDFINRERKATTGIGEGVAIPHIRTMQARELIIGFARSENEIDFDSLDGQPTRMFFIMAAPPYDDSLYLKVFKSLSENLQYESFREELMSANQPYDIIRAFKNME